MRGIGAKSIRPFSQNCHLFTLCRAVFGGRLATSSHLEVSLKIILAVHQQLSKLCLRKTLNQERYEQRAMIVLAPLRLLVFWGMLSANMDMVCCLFSCITSATTAEQHEVLPSPRVPK